jgi:hypothetical protein
MGTMPIFRELFRVIDGDDMSKKPPIYNLNVYILDDSDYDSPPHCASELKPCACDAS